MRRILEGFGDLGQGRESFPTSPENDPDGVVRELSGRVVRGGSWNNNPRNARASNRNRNDPDNRNNNIGFRCAQRLPIWKLTFQEESFRPGCRVVYGHADRVRKSHLAIPARLRRSITVLRNRAEKSRHPALW